MFTPFKLFVGESNWVSNLQANRSWKRYKSSTLNPRGRKHLPVATCGQMKQHWNLTFKEEFSFWHGRLSQRMLESDLKYLAGQHYLNTFWCGVKTWFCITWQDCCIPGTLFTPLQTKLEENRVTLSDVLPDNKIIQDDMSTVLLAER